MDGQTELLFDRFNEEIDNLKAENARLRRELAAARAVLAEKQYAFRDPRYGTRECIECAAISGHPHRSDCARGAAMRGEV